MKSWAKIAAFYKVKIQIPKYKEAIHKAVQERMVFSVEILNYCKDGTPFWNHLTISPVFDDEGGVTHFVGVQRDVTLMVDMRQKLKDHSKQNQVLKLTVKSLLKRINEQEVVLKKLGPIDLSGE